MQITRRSFVAAAGAAAAGCVLPPFASAGRKSRWYKGMLHAHTLWSDGRVLPEQAVRAYKDAGYDFFSITDHNRIGSDPDRWMKVAPPGGSWPPVSVEPKVFEAFRRDFPEAPWRERGGVKEVRVSTIAETYARFSEPGKFLCMHGCEFTTNVTMPDGSWRDLHVNCIGLDELIPCARTRALYYATKKDTVAQTIGMAKAQLDALARGKGNAPSLFFVNHPQWRFSDVLPRDLVANPTVRFFEVCNNGSSFAPVPPLPDDGFFCDRFWDAVNAVRCLKGEPLLYGVATDDSHGYPGCGIPASSYTFGDGWIGVRAGALQVADLFAAMEKGDFYAASGVDFDDIDFDGRKGTLTVSVPAKPGVSHVVRFITTKRGADTELRSVAIPGEGKRQSREAPIFSDTVGRTEKSVSFAPGQPVLASYTLASDDLYVRARVESSEPAIVKRHMHPVMKTGWTQPFRPGGV